MSPVDSTTLRRGVLTAVALGCAAVVLLGIAGSEPTTPTPHGATPSSNVGPWRLVGLGDSITSGAGCPGCTNFVDLYAHDITDATAVPVGVTNLGVPGWTSTDLLTSLSDPTTVGTVAEADIVVVTIGANDFLPMLDPALSGQCGGADGLSCFDSALGTLHDNLTAILDRIRELRGGRPTAVRVTGYWNVFLDGHVADATYGPLFQRTSGALTQRVNATIQGVADAEKATYIDLYTPFKGPGGDDDDTPLLAPDGDHPSQGGHQEIAEALTAAGLAPLRGRR